MKFSALLRPMTEVPAPALLSSVPVFTKFGIGADVYWMPESFWKSNVELFVNVAPVLSRRFPLPAQFTVPAFVTLPPSPTLFSPPEPVSIEPDGIVNTPVIAPPVQFVVPAKVAVPPKFPDSSVRLLLDVIVPPKVLLVVTRFEPAP